MPYTKFTFEDGKVLEAKQLNAMETGIANATNIAEMAYKTSNPFSFAGKTLLVTGDSITESNFRADILWHDYLKNWYGLAAVKNDGLSGSGLVKNNGIVYRIDNWDKKYGAFDMILIMGNMNDGTSGVTGKPEWFGSFEDQDDAQKDTSLYGALHYTLRTLTTKYPNTPIGWIISQPRSQVGDQGKCWGIDGWFEKWVTAIKEVCGHYSIPVLDLYHESNILRPWIPENNKKYFSCSASPNGDGIHPNGLGQAAMAKKIYAWMNQYMEADFIESTADRELVSVSSVELIGSPVVGTGSTVTWSAIVSPNNATNPTVTWYASNNNVTLNPAIETFGATCEISGMTDGTCDITITSEDGGFTATKTITVGDAENLSIYDDFDRENTTSGLGTASNGKEWDLSLNASGCGMKIDNNTAKGINDKYHFATMTVESSNYLVEATVTPESSKQLLILSRVAAANNYIAARLGTDGIITLLYKQNGVNHEIVKTTEVYNSTVKLGLEVIGTACKVFVDDVQILEGVINLNTTNTVVGFSLQGSNAYIDDFRVVYK